MLDVEVKEKSLSELFLNFIGVSQFSALMEILEGEEKEFANDLIVKLGDVFKTMPKTGETDGQGKDALVKLHYFFGNMDAFIIEKDMIEDEQIQAYGYMRMGADGELGYISIVDLLANGFELDFHWEEKSIRAALAER